MQMVRRDNKKGIIQAAENILKKLNVIFQKEDSIHVKTLYDDPILRHNLEPELCCEILIGLADLEAPFEISGSESSVLIECHFTDEDRAKRFVETMTWVNNSEPDILEAAATADENASHCADL